MIEIVEIKNPFEPRKEKRTVPVTNGTVFSYIDDAEHKNIYLDGMFVSEPDKCFPQDGSQIVVTPIVGKSLKKILGWTAMIALTVYAGGWAGSLGKAIGWTSKLGQAVLSTSIIFLGGKITNGIFHINQTGAGDNNSSPTYGWDLPTVQTAEGGTIGETYGECMPSPQLLMEHVETTNSDDQDDNTQYLNLLYCGGWGPVDSISNIRIGTTPIESFSDVQIETRLGTNDQEPISFFPNTVTDQSIGLMMKLNSPITRSTDATNAERIDVTVEFPNGLYYINDKGNYANNEVKFKIEYKLTTDTDWTVAGNYSLTKASGTAVRRTYTIASNLKAGRYDVRVTATSMNTGTRYMSDMEWSLISTWSYDGAKTHPGKVLVAMRIKATNQLSGGIPDVNWRQMRKTVYVWNPNTEAYEEKSARNPVWAAYDILHGCKKLRNINTGEDEYVVYGSDKKNFTQYFDQWQEAADYADEQIENNLGEMEARFEFDAYYDTVSSKWDAAQKAAAVGRAAIIRHGTQYGITVDKPGSIVQMFGEGQTTQSSVKGTFSSSEERARAVQVTYNDTDNDFKNTPFLVRSPTYAEDLTKQDNTANLTLFGVKRRTQAYREAVFLLATNERELQTVTVGADIGGIVSEYGDVVGINHAVPQIGLSSGRIVSVDGNVVKLDKPVTLSANTQYGVIFSLSTNDKLVGRQIVPVTAGTTTDTITVSTPFDTGEVPALYDPYAIGLNGAVLKPFKITKVQSNKDNKVQLTCMEYDEAVYDVDYSKYPIIDYTPSAQLKAPTNLSLVENKYYREDGSVLYSIIATWIPDSSMIAEKYRVYYSKDNVTWTYWGDTPATTVTILDLDPTSVYYVRVCAVKDIISSPYATAQIDLSEGNTPAVTPTISAATQFREISNGTGLYSIRVSWNPSNVTGGVYYKTNHVQAQDLTIAEGTASDQLGYAGAWIFAGYGVGEVIIPQAIEGDTYKIAVATADSLGHYTNPDESAFIEYQVVRKSTIPNTPDGFIVSFSDTANLKWNEVTNADISLYELRTNNTPGVLTSGMLVQTGGHSANLMLPSRSGTLYLYAKSTIGKYSAPAVLTYNKALPRTPDAPQVVPKLGGLSIVAGAIPSDCIGMIAYINNTAVKTVNNTLTYSCGADIYDVTVSYYDLFGEGQKSASTRVTVKTTVSSDDLDDMAVTADKLEKTVQDAVTAAQESVPAIEGLQDNIGDINGAVTGIQQDIGSLSSAVNDNNQQISELQQTADGITTTVQSNKEAQDGVNDSVSKDISQIKQDAESLTSTVKSNTDDITQIKQTASDISSTVQSNKSAQDTVNDSVSADISQIKQSATELTATVQDNTDDISQLKQTATGISSTVQANKTAQDNINAQLQTQIDKSITTWFYSGVPTLANAPAKDWTDNDTKNVHLGDLYYDTGTNHAYRFQLVGSTYSWGVITDTSVTAALAAAQTAQDTADGKRRVFISTPVAPYDVGDLWTQGTAGDLMRCNTAKASGQVYSASDWGKASKYTDDTALNSFVAGTYKTDKASLSSQITQTADSITGVVQKLNGDADADGQYSAITQLSDAISLAVKADGVISSINLSKEGIEIDGKLIHITGDTVIDGNIITSAMIQANAITADKISVGSLSAISATIGTFKTATTGERTEISDNGLEVYDENNNLIIQLGIFPD